MYTRNKRRSFPADFYSLIDDLMFYGSINSWPFISVKGRVVDKFCSNHAVLAH